MAGNSSGKIAIAICGRCSFKMKYTELSSDPNVPGLQVCKECRDNIDPYRLAPRQPDSYLLQKPRPDTNLSFQAPDSSDYLSDEFGNQISDQNGDNIVVEHL